MNIGLRLALRSCSPLMTEYQLKTAGEKKRAWAFLCTAPVEHGGAPALEVLDPFPASGAKSILHVLAARISQKIACSADLARRTTASSSRWLSREEI